ncbi:ATP-dependent DNA ligase [Paenibacillus sp. SAFN-117]|uniref:ATP-dependent DNA ligase n=1 Tax=Paenibacillus sp. SAFN-117 TaxID=3436860 RepID=UPI003F800DC6
MIYEPMIPIRQDKPFDDPAYLFEPKVEGHRVLLVHQNGITRLFTRHGHEITHRYPELVRVPVNEDVVLDGEAAFIDPATGKLEPALAKERIRLNKRKQIYDAQRLVPARFFVFDILQRGGEDLRPLPLAERKRHLEEAITDNDYFYKMKYVEGCGRALFQAALELGAAAGVVAKRIDSPYIAGLSPEWRQIPCYRTEKVYVTGYCKRGSGWLIGVQADNGEIKSAGLVGSDVIMPDRIWFVKAAAKLYSGEDHHYVYLKPGIEAELTFQGWTKDGKVRKPVCLNRPAALRLHA